MRDKYKLIIKYYILYYVSSKLPIFQKTPITKSKGRKAWI